MMLILFITTALTVISLITLSNAFLFPRLKKPAAPLDDAPLISVMIPARNEAAVIGATIERLMAQDYPNYELLVLDDNSDDGTGEIARQAGDPARLRVIPGQPLPDGWMGKNWACHQMQQVAGGDYLIFTDADVRWEPGALSALIADMQRTKADLYTIWPTQETITWGERLCVSLMAIVVIGYLPVIGTHYVPLSVFGAANGQCMAWRREAYDAVGGHEIVGDNVLEDVTLGRMVKGRGMRLRMADGNQLVSCRMYDSWPAVRDGYAKNIIAGYGGVVPLLLSTVFHFLIFILPVVWLAFGWLTPQIPGRQGWPLALVAMGVTVRAFTAAFTHQRVLDALLMPISVILMTRIAAQAIWWQYRYGGPKWKGRVVTKKSKRKAVTR